MVRQTYNGWKMEILTYAEVEEYQRVRRWRGRPYCCGCLKLNAHELVGGFERLAIACPYGDAEKRGAAAGLRRTPHSHRAAVGLDRAAPSNRRAGARRNLSQVLSAVGSAVSDIVIALVATMARPPDHRPARDGVALAL